MRMESHASPTHETPHQRYAALHRAIERGLVSDAVWKELAEVSLELGHVDECTRCVRRIDNPTLRKALESRLARLEEDQRARTAHPAAPAASHAGPSEPRGTRSAEPTDDDGPPGIVDHLTDALQYLLLQHMPWLILVTVLAFPLVVGLGGFLTAGTPPLAFAAIAALPSLCVLAVIGAMARRILVESARGIADVPGLPALGELTREALRFGGDALLVLVAFSLPGGATWLFSRSQPATAAVFGVAMAMAPMAFLLRQLRGGWSAIAPWTVMVAVARGRLSYLALAAVCWALLTPAGLLAWKVHHQPIWLQVSCIGPAIALPLFFAARLLGTWVDVNRSRLGQSLAPTAKAAALATAAVAAPATPVAAEPTRRGHAPGATRPRPLAKQPTVASQPARTAAPAAPAAPAAAAPQRQQPAARPATQPARTPAKPQPQARPKAEPKPKPKPQPTAKPAAKPKAASKAAPGVAPEPAAAPEPHAIEGRRPQAPQLTDQPDLTGMPGAVKVSGRDRIRAGAAVRRS